MNDLAWKLEHWTRYRNIVDREQERLAILRQPLPKLDTPELDKPTKVKVVKAFVLDRHRTAQPGEIVTVRWVLARDLLARKRVTLAE